MRKLRENPNTIRPKFISDKVRRLNWLPGG